ncbi:hypothetical protein SmB9_14040 [Sphingosinicella microcystinivorans]|uniref:Uncharacterized protein n=1 Tax=Sphingosinicella microcystinivorans TaxID=335406 RepID=A0AAD1G0N8_SPHMI|nr:hypothetical protein SmB9_14040 [Sphingosinicella microcystinivorans]
MMLACKTRSPALPVLTDLKVRSAPVLADHAFRLSLTRMKAYLQSLMKSFDVRSDHNPPPVRKATGVCAA